VRGEERKEGVGRKKNPGATTTLTPDGGGKNKTNDNDNENKTTKNPHRSKYLFVQEFSRKKKEKHSERGREGYRR
jgi:hypothetical protein